MKYNKGPPKEALVKTGYACLFDEGECAYHSWHGVWEEDLWSKNGVMTLGVQMRQIGKRVKRTGWEI